VLKARLAPFGWHVVLVSRLADSAIIDIVERLSVSGTEVYLCTSDSYLTARLGSLARIIPVDTHIGRRKNSRELASYVIKNLSLSG